MKNWCAPFTKCLFILFFYFYAPLFAANENISKNTLKSGWYLLDPYQYLKTPGDSASLTGLDIALQKLILKHAGFDVTLSHVSWKQHQEDLKTGIRDIAMGAFYSDERSKYSYFSEPYRFEENSLFILKDGNKKFNFQNIEVFLADCKKQSLKIGIVAGYRYADETLNNFIANPENKNIFIVSESDNHNLDLLINKKIDGFLSDRIVGATIIWRENVGRLVEEKRLNIKAPVHMLMSKATITEQQRDQINQAIQDIKKSEDYAKTISWYLYPVLLLETTDSTWFIIVEMIGIIAFALSGIVIGYRCNASLLGTFLLALLPSFGGGILRDVMFGRYPVWFMQAKVYILIVLVIIIISFFILRFFAKHQNHWLNTYFERKKIDPVQIFDTGLAITDALGLAAFTVTGVIVSLIVKADPLWLWGPFFAFLTGAGGGMLRDIVVKNMNVGAIHGPIYGEIAIFWGLILSLFLTLTADSVDHSHIEIAVITTIVAAFLTRIFVYYYKIPNLFILGRENKS